MEILKHIHYKDLEIKVIRIESQKVETIKTEQTTETQTSVAWAKKADRSEGASYAAKEVKVEIGKGDFNFGIAITRSK
jgi:hypothetical protein